MRSCIFQTRPNTTDLTTPQRQTHLYTRRLLLLLLLLPILIPTCARTFIILDVSLPYHIPRLMTALQRSSELDLSRSVNHTHSVILCFVGSFVVVGGMLYSQGNRCIHTLACNTFVVFGVLAFTVWEGDLVFTYPKCRIVILLVLL
jgi:hypothetical protein